MVCAKCPCPRDLVTHAQEAIGDKEGHEEVIRNAERPIGNEDGDGDVSGDVSSGFGCDVES